MNTLIFHSNDLAMAYQPSVQPNPYIQSSTRQLIDFWCLFCAGSVQQFCDVVINHCGLDKIINLFDNKPC